MNQKETLTMKENLTNEEVLMKHQQQDKVDDISHFHTMKNNDNNNNDNNELDSLHFTKFIDCEYERKHSFLNDNDLLQNVEKWNVPFDVPFPVDDFSSKLDFDSFQFFSDRQLFDLPQQQQQQQQKCQTNSLDLQQINDECYFIDDNDYCDNSDDQIPQQNQLLVGCNNSLTFSSSSSSMTLTKTVNSSNVTNEPTQPFFIKANTIDINDTNIKNTADSHPISMTIPRLSTKTTSPTNHSTFTITKSHITTSSNHFITTSTIFPNTNSHHIHNFHISKHFSNNLYHYYSISSNVTSQKRNYRKPKSLLVKALKDYMQYKHTTQKFIAHQIEISASTLSKFMRGEERKRGWRKVERRILTFLQEKNNSLFDTPSFCDFSDTCETQTQTNTFLTSL